VAAPYPISAGILPALPEYHCHCSPVTTDKLVACHSQKSRRHLENLPFGCTRTSGAAKNVHDLPKAHIPPDLPKPPHSPLLGHSPFAMGVALPAPLRS
jgi:hypothetical protein